MCQLLLRARLGISKQMVTNCIVNRLSWIFLNHCYNFPSLFHPIKLFLSQSISYNSKTKVSDLSLKNSQLFCASKKKFVLKHTCFFPEFELINGLSRCSSFILAMPSETAWSKSSLNRLSWKHFPKEISQVEKKCNAPKFF